MLRDTVIVPKNCGIYYGDVDDWAVIVGDCNDCPENSKPADVFFSDPPYNYALDYGPLVNDRVKKREEFLQYWLHRLTLGAMRVRPGGAIWVMMPDEWIARVAVHFEDTLGLERRNWIVWNETFGTNQNEKFSRCKRHILYYLRGLKGTPYFDGDAVRVPSDRQLKYNDKRANPKGKVPGDVWKFSRVCGTFKERATPPPGLKLPTQLPESLLYRIVMSTCPVGGHVLEFCVGTGSMGRTVLRAGKGRSYEGWEIDPSTADFASKRIAEAGSLRGQPPPNASPEESSSGGEEEAPGGLG